MTYLLHVVLLCLGVISLGILFLLCVILLLAVRYYKFWSDNWYCKYMEAVHGWAETLAQQKQKNAESKSEGRETANL